MSSSSSVASSSDEEASVVGNGELDPLQRRLDHFFGRSNKRRRTESSNAPLTWKQTSAILLKLDRRRADLEAELRRVNERIRQNSRAIDSGLLGAAHMWTPILDFLPFEDLIQMSATNGFFLREVAPLLGRLYLTDPRQFRLEAAAGRFRNVWFVNLVDQRDYADRTRYRSTVRVLPFLRSLPRIQSVDFDGLYATRRVKHKVLKDLCQMMFPRQVEVWNIHCESHFALDTDDENEDTDGEEETADEPALCELCCRICDTFTPRCVAGAVTPDLDGDIIGGLLPFVCIPYQEAISILCQRISGETYVESDDALIDTLYTSIPSKWTRIDGKFCLDGHRDEICVNSTAAAKIKVLMKHGLRPAECNRKKLLDSMYWEARNMSFPGEFGEARFRRDRFDELVSLGVPLRRTDFILYDYDENSS